MRDDARSKTDNPTRQLCPSCGNPLGRGRCRVLDIWELARAPFAMMVRSFVASPEIERIVAGGTFVAKGTSVRVLGIGVRNGWPWTLIEVHDAAAPVRGWVPSQVLIGGKTVKLRDHAAPGKQGA